MKKFLIVVDMQHDFIDGVLGTKEACEILPRVIEKIQSFDGEILYTRDTHEEQYLSTREGKHLPMAHCIRGTKGWQLHSALEGCRQGEIFDKPTFGSLDLVNRLLAEQEKEPIESVTLVGLCTDICVISNAMLIKAALPEADLFVDSSCCAGVTPQRHECALDAMEACQITILR